MTNVIKFPTPYTAQIRLTRNKIEKEIIEVYSRTDEEIISKFGSMEKYGQSIIDKVIKTTKRSMLNDRAE